MRHAEKKMEASVFLTKCSKDGAVFGTRIQKMEDDDWWRTWAFPIDDKRAAKEKYTNTEIKGNLYALKSFPGCPYCGTKGFVQCGRCHKITCWNNEESLLCGWCGNNMTNIVTKTEKFNVSGGDI